MARNVDVIVVHFRRPADVRALVSDLIAMNGDEIGRIVICDNSFDDERSRPEVADLTGRHGTPEVIYHGRANDGYGAAVNDGFRLLSSKGDLPEFVFVVTHDLRIEPETLPSLVAGARSHPRAGVVGPVLRDARDGVSVWSTGGTLTAVMQTARHVLAVPGGPVRRQWVDGSAMLVRTRAMHDVNLIAESFFLYKEDVELCCRLRDEGWEVWVVPAAVAEQSPGGHDTTFLAVRNTFWLHIGNRRWLALTLWLAENSARVGVGYLRGRRVHRERQRERLRAIWSGLNPPDEIRARAMRVQG